MRHGSLISAEFLECTLPSIAAAWADREREARAVYSEVGDLVASLRCTDTGCSREALAGDFVAPVLRALGFCPSYLGPEPTVSFVLFDDEAHAAQHPTTLKGAVAAAGPRSGSLLGQATGVVAVSEWGTDLDEAEVCSFARLLDVARRAVNHAKLGGDDPGALAEAVQAQLQCALEALGVVPSDPCDVVDMLGALAGCRDAEELVNAARRVLATHESAASTRLPAKQRHLARGVAQAMRCVVPPVTTPSDPSVDDVQLCRLLLKGPESCRESPSQQLRSFLTDHHVRFGMLTNGRQWRLYCSECTQGSTYVKFDLWDVFAAGTACVDEFRRFFAFFGCWALPHGRPSVVAVDGSRTPRKRAHVALLHADTGYQADCFVQYALEHDKRYGTEAMAHLQSVVRQAAGDIATALHIALDSTSTPELDEEALRSCAVRVALRICFVNMAEDLGVLATRPLVSSLICSIGEEDRPDSEVWQDLVAVFAAVRHTLAHGSGEVGTLFASIDPFESALRSSFGSTPQDVYLSLALRALGYRGGDRRRINYAPVMSVSSTGLGDLYVALCGTTLSRESVGTHFRYRLTMTALHSIRESAAYYTPCQVVSYLVGEGLSVQLSHLKSLALSSGRPLLDLVLQHVRVVDPTMGSGHFLVGALTYLSQQVTAFDFGGGDSARPNVTRDEARGLIAAHCLFGTDLEPEAVELARCAVLLHLPNIMRTPGKLLEALDSNLRVGNSVFGCARLSDILESDCAATWMSSEGYALLEDVQAAVLRAYRESTVDGGVTPAWRETRLYRCLRVLANVRIASSLGFGRATARSADIRAVLGAISEPDAGMVGLLLPHVREGLMTSPWDVKARRREVELFADERDCIRSAFHWPIEYPDVLLGDNAGFSAVVGNPPWNTLTVDKKEWNAVLKGRAGLNRQKLQREMEEEKCNNEVVKQSANGSGLFARQGKGIHDLWCLVLERSMYLTSPRGVLAVITPKGLIDGGEKTRRLTQSILFAPFCLRDVRVWGKQTLWPDAAVQAGAAINCAAVIADSAAPLVGAAGSGGAVEDYAFSFSWYDKKAYSTQLRHLRSGLCASSGERGSWKAAEKAKRVTDLFAGLASTPPQAMVSTRSLSRDNPRLGMPVPAELLESFERMISPVTSGIMQYRAVFGELFYGAKGFNLANASGVAYLAGHALSSSAAPDNGKKGSRVAVIGGDGCQAFHLDVDTGLMHGTLPGLYADSDFDTKRSRKVGALEAPPRGQCGDRRLLLQEMVTDNLTEQYKVKAAVASDMQRARDSCTMWTAKAGHVQDLAHAYAAVLNSDVFNWLYVKRFGQKNHTACGDIATMRVPAVNCRSRAVREGWQTELGDIRAIVASEEPVGLSATCVAGGTIAGRDLHVNDRVLLTAQVNGQENGVWLVTNAGRPARPEYFDVGSLAGGLIVAVVSTGKRFVCASPAGSDVVGSDSLVWAPCEPGVLRAADHRAWWDTVCEHAIAWEGQRAATEPDEARSLLVRKQLGALMQPACDSPRELEFAVAKAMLALEHAGAAMTRESAAIWGRAQAFDEKAGKVFGVTAKWKQEFQTGTVSGQRYTTGLRLADKLGLRASARLPRGAAPAIPNGKSLVATLRRSRSITAHPSTESVGRIVAAYDELVEAAEMWDATKAYIMGAINDTVCWLFGVASPQQRLALERDMGGRPDGVACGDGSATDSDGGASVRGQPSTAHTTECWEEYAVGWTPAAPVPKHVQDSRLRSRCEQRGYVIVPETPTVDLADVVLHLLGHSVDKTTFVRGCAERLDAQASRLLSGSPPVATMATDRGSCAVALRQIPGFDAAVRSAHIGDLVLHPATLLTVSQVLGRPVMLVTVEGGGTCRVVRIADGSESLPGLAIGHYGDGRCVPLVTRVKRLAQVSGGSGGAGGRGTAAVKRRRAPRDRVVRKRDRKR